MFCQSKTESREKLLQIIAEECQRTNLHPKQLKNHRRRLRKANNQLQKLLVEQCKNQVYQESKGNKGDDGDLEDDRRKLQETLRSQEIEKEELRKSLLKQEKDFKKAIKETLTVSNEMLEKVQGYEKENSNLKAQLREKRVQERRKTVELQELQEHVVELKKMSSRYQNERQKRKNKKQSDLQDEGKMLRNKTFLDQTINVVENILKDQQHIYMNQTFECYQDSSLSLSNTEEEKDSITDPNYNDKIVELILKEYIF